MRWVVRPTTSIFFSLILTLALFGVVGFANAAEVQVLYDRISGNDWQTSGAGTHSLMIFDTVTYPTCASIPNWEIDTMVGRIRAAGADSVTVYLNAFDTYDVFSSARRVATSSTISIESATTTATWEFSNAPLTRDVCNKAMSSSGGEDYWLMLQFVSTNGNAFNLNRSNSDIDSIAELADPYDWSGLISGVNWGASQIQWIFPTNGSVSTYFRNWEFDVTAPSATTSFLINVFYGEDPDQDNIDSLRYTASTSDVIRVKVPKSKQLGNGYYSARADMYAGTSRWSAGSIRFQVSNAGFSGITSSSTVKALSFCGNDSNWLVAITAGGFCKVIVYLFNPTQNFTDYTAGLFDNINERFPFSMLFDITDSFQDLSQVASSSPSIIYTAVNFNGTDLLDTTGVPASTTIFNNSTYQRHSLLTNFRNMLGRILYLVFGFILFFRIKALV